MSIFKFWYEKFLMRFSFTFAFFAFIGVFVYAYLTEVTAKLPGDTAPFSELLIEDNSNSLLPNQLDLPLEKPHKTDKELKNWLSMVVSESFSFDKNNFSDASKNIRPYFTESGLRQYGGYLKSSGIMDSIKSNDYRMRAFVDGPPLLIENMAIKNIYRWKYQVPVSIGFSPRLPLNSPEITNRKLDIIVQVRRLKRGDDPSVVAIESWEVKARR